MFQNAGCADFYALFFVGFTDKAGDAESIGMFGSGFKLAVAAAMRLGIELVEGPYQPAEWGRAVRPHRELPEGSIRCESCYRLRMVQTARLARERGLDLFSVTLTVSRHKNSKVLERIGREVAQAEGVAYLAEDFKKQDGYNQSVCLSRELGLRRQDYCGCSISRAEAQDRRRRKEAASR